MAARFGHSRQYSENPIVRVRHGTAVKLKIVVTLASLTLASPFSWSTDIVEPPRKGLYKVEFTPRELLGEQGALDAADILHNNDNIGWQIYVPDNYDAAVPPGVIVYVSPQDKGGPPGTWKRALHDKNLIWIGANNAGNRVAVGKRMFLAMLAPRVLAKDYVLDVDRIYISGFSGGGKTANRVSSANPDVFRGGIYIAGAEMWGSKTPPPKLDLIKENYHVFLTGTSDFNEMLTRRVYTAYKSVGAENSKLIVVRRLGHQLPDKKTFEQAIDYLDSRKYKE